MLDYNMNWIYVISVVIFTSITLTFSAKDVERYLTARSIFANHYTQGDLEQHEQFYQVGQDPYYDDYPENPNKYKGKYSCLRHCGRNFKPELCYYKFKIERYQTFSKNCDQTPLSTKKYFDDGCVTGDGTKMRVLTVNKMLPGTAIHICQGDTLIVDVENLLPDGKAVSIHWHGFKHLHSQWMDGVSFLTQCPIGSNQKFRYTFEALEAGTFFYHASNNEQHVRGLAGPLIIRSKEDIGRNKWYNTDVYSHTIFIQDLMHEKDDLKFPFTDSRGRFLSPSSYLINGRGQYKEKGKLGFSRRTDSPLAEFRIEELAKARFRIIAGTNSSCSFKLAIEKHFMTVIAVDGNYINPVKVGTIHMHAGERLDVVVDASLKVNSYWIRVQGNDLCSSARQHAILHYQHSKKKKPSSKSSKAIFTQFSKTYPDLNNFSLGCRKKNINLCWEHLQPEGQIPEALLGSARVRLIEIEAARIKLVDPALAESPISKEKFNLALGHDYLEDIETFNKISCQLPPFAMLKQFYEEVPEDLECERNNNIPQQCFYVINLELNEVIDLMFKDVTYRDFTAKQKKDSLISYDRSIHFHGHSVLILQQGTLEDLRIQSPDLYHSRDTISSRIFKDTVSIPKDGYTVVRLQATNPGIWALETPITDGNGEGVALAFQVGDKNFNQSGVRVPLRLPECNDFVPPVKKLEPTEERIDEHAETRNEGSSSTHFQNKPNEEDRVERSPRAGEGEITVEKALALPPRLQMSPNVSPLGSARESPLGSVRESPLGSARESPLGSPLNRDEKVTSFK